MARVFFVTFYPSTRKTQRTSKFVVIANDKDDAIELAWETGGEDLERNYGKRSAAVVEMKRGARRVL